MDTYEAALTLMTASDEEFAEIFAYASKLHSNGVNGPDSVIPSSEPTLTKEDFENIETFMQWLKDCAVEIATSEECDLSAWWKQEEAV